MFVRRVLLNPRQHFPVAFAGGEFGFQRLGRYPGETEPVIVARIIVFVFTRCPGDLGAVFIEDVGENDVAAETHAWTAWRTLGDIRGVI
jgi:hypothetical protein